MCVFIVDIILCQRSCCPLQGAGCRYVYQKVGGLLVEGDCGGSEVSEIGSLNLAAASSHP